MCYKEVRDEIMAYVERKRDLFGSQVKARDVDRFEHDEWEKYAAEKDITWWGGDTVLRCDSSSLQGELEGSPLHQRKKGTLSLPERARASTAASPPTKVVAKALEGKAIAKREVGKVVASSMELVTGVENGATRNRDVGEKMSTWKGSFELELNTRTTLKKRKMTRSKVPIWRVWR